MEKEIPIGYSTTLENNKDGNFYTKKRRILTEALPMKITKDRNVFKEKKVLYEADSKTLERQRFSMENGLGIPKLAFMLGISSESTNETKDRSLLYIFDYKYVLTSFESEILEPEKLWEFTTDEFQKAIYYLVQETKTNPEESLIKTYDFMDRFGTHLITSCDVGYRFRKMFKTDKNETESVKDFELDSKLKIMEYFGMNNEYTSKMSSNNMVSSKESETLILGHKHNVMTAIKGSEFKWKTETTNDTEVIDIHPLNYIPIYQLVPIPEVRDNIKKVVEEREYELSMGWDKGRNYCCAYLETDPGFFTGELVLDLELDIEKTSSTNKKHRILINSTQLQKHKLEFLDQRTRPESITIDCSRWRKLANKTTIIRIYYRDESTYMATIKDIISPNLEKMTYILNWEFTPLDYMLNENPIKRTPFGI